MCFVRKLSRLFVSFWSQREDHLHMKCFLLTISIDSKRFLAGSTAQALMLAHNIHPALSRASPKSLASRTASCGHRFNKSTAEEKTLMTLSWSATTITSTIRRRKSEAPPPCSEEMPTDSVGLDVMLFARRFDSTCSRVVQWFRNDRDKTCKRTLDPLC